MKFIHNLCTITIVYKFKHNYNALSTKIHPTTKCAIGKNNYKT